MGVTRSLSALEVGLDFISEQYALFLPIIGILNNIMCWVFECQYLLYILLGGRRSHFSRTVKFNASGGSIQIRGQSCLSALACIAKEKTRMGIWF